MKHLLMLVPVILAILKFWWLALFVEGLWDFWYSWRLIFDPDSAWMEEEERLRAQGIVPQRTNEWNRNRIVYALGYSLMGLGGITAGVLVLAIL